MVSMYRFLKAIGFSGDENKRDTTFSDPAFLHDGKSNSSKPANSTSFSSLPVDVRERIWLLLAGPFLSPVSGPYWIPLAGCDSHEVKINETWPAYSSRHTLLLQICQETRAIALKLYCRVDHRSAALARLDTDNFSFYKTYSIPKLFNDLANGHHESHGLSQSQAFRLNYGVSMATKDEILTSVRHLTIRGPLGSDLMVLAQFVKLQTCTFVTIESEYKTLIGLDSSNKSVVAEWNEMFCERTEPPQLLFLERIDYKRGLVLRRNREGQWQWILQDVDGDEVIEAALWFDRNLGIGAFKNANA